MNLDINIIVPKIQEINSSGGAVIFAIGDFYVQLASIEPGQFQCEAVSHHYHTPVDITLESSFIKLGYHLEEGGNYSKIAFVNSPDDAQKLADEIEIIFRDYYRADNNILLK